MFADLHIHTHYSDGTQSPEQVAEIAKQANVSLLSVTDHDTVAAYPSLLEACRRLGISLVQGVELDVTWGAYWLHLLAYGFDPAHKAIQDLMQQCQNELEKVNLETIQALAPTHPNLSLSSYHSFQKEASLGGWKGLQYLYHNGLAPSLADAMKFFSASPYSPAFPSLQAACTAIRSAGGIPVLAHPGNWWNDPAELPNLFSRLLQDGIGGVECHYPSHNQAFTHTCIEFCRQHGLVITSGGDGHGDFLPVVDSIVYSIGILKTETEHLDLKGVPLL